MEEDLPNKWTGALSVPSIYKHKGARDDPASYRMIYLLSRLYKIIAVILVQRNQTVTEATIRDNHAERISSSGVAMITSTSSESF